MTAPPVVFLVDVDNTLLDNDRIQEDLRRHLEREFGAAARDRYWAILEARFVELGYRDYLGALQRYRVEHPEDVHLMMMSSYLVDYPFANRLFPGRSTSSNGSRGWGPTVILSDGDVVFQPRKVQRSGIWQAVDGHVLIYIHKEEALDDVERALSGAALRPGGRQTANPGRGQGDLGRPRHHDVSPPGSVRARRECLSSS